MSQNPPTPEPVPEPAPEQASAQASAQVPVPGIDPRLTNPTPVLVLGITGWVVALVVIALTGDRWQDSLATCVAGIVVGALGLALYLAQRAAARRGSKTAQRGLT